MARRAYRWQNERRALAASPGTPGSSIKPPKKNKKRRKPSTRVGRAYPPATRKQLDYIAALAGELGEPPPTVTNSRAASGRIDILKSRVDTARRADRAARATAK